MGKKLLQMEMGQTGDGSFAQLADSSDHKMFDSPAQEWSGADGFAPELKPDGVETGGLMSPGAAADTVDIAALSAWVGGALRSVSAQAGLAVPRPTTDPFRIHSLTVDNTGTLAVVSGVEGASPSGVRGAAGGPPWIPVGEVEAGQVHQSSKDAAVILGTEIKQLHNVSLERSVFPGWHPETMMALGGVDFTQSLPLVHSDNAGTDSETKGVWARFFEPDLSDLPNATDFVPVTEQFSTNSIQTYDGAISSLAVTLQAGTFTQYVEDAITDPVSQAVSDVRWFYFYPDVNKTAVRRVQGTVGVAPAYPADGRPSIAVTIAPVDKGKALAA